MDIRKLCHLGSRTIELDRCCDERRPVNSPPPSSPSEGQSKLRWIVLLMKFKKEKRKMFQVPYDAYTYSQNFDQGFAWDEPDSFSRSFSVRFADPNRIFLMKSQGWCKKTTLWNFGSYNIFAFFGLMYRFVYTVFSYKFEAWSMMTCFLVSLLVLSFC